MSLSNLTACGRLDDETITGNPPCAATLSTTTRTTPSHPVRARHQNGMRAQAVHCIEQRLTERPALQRQTEDEAVSGQARQCDLGQRGFRRVRASEQPRSAAVVHTGAGDAGRRPNGPKREAQGWVSCQALQPAVADQPFARGRADMARVAPTGRRPRLRAATGKRAKPTEARASPAWAGPHCAVRPMAVRGGVCPCARREIWSLTASMPRCRDALSRCRLVRRTARVTANYCSCDLSAAANGCDPMEARGRTFETCWLPCGMRWMRWMPS